MLGTAGMGQKKARHLHNKYHYTNELFRENKVKVVRVVTDDQPVDLPTKGSHTAKETHQYTMREVLHLRCASCCIVCVIAIPII